jgi:hypothetical protein
LRTLDGISVVLAGVIGALVAHLVGLPLWLSVGAAFAVGFGAYFWTRAGY